MRVVRDVPVPTHVEEVTDYGSWARLSEAHQYMPPEPYIDTEMMQLRSVNVHVPSVPNYRDISMTNKAVCDTGLQLYRKSSYDLQNAIISLGMVFNTMSELKLFL